MAKHKHQHAANGEKPAPAAAASAPSTVPPAADESGAADAIREPGSITTEVPAAEAPTAEAPTADTVPGISDGDSAVSPSEPAQPAPAPAPTAVTIDDVLPEVAGKCRGEVETPGALVRRPTPTLTAEQSRMQSHLYHALLAKGMPLRRQQDVYGWLLDQVALAADQLVVTGAMPAMPDSLESTR